MHRSLPRRVVSVLSAFAAAAALGALAPAPAHATATPASCTDSSGVRWDVAVTWGAPYTVDGTRKVSLRQAAWTTAAGKVGTASTVRTYDGDGALVQTQSWTGTFDYRNGQASKSRNPVNPVSAPGRAKVVVTVGAKGSAGCSVTSVQPSASDRYESAVLAATNSERTDRDLVALEAQACVDSYAESQARAMAEQQSMYHQDLGPILQACDLRTVGENVAYGYPTGQAVTAAWMESPGHRANILKAGYRLLGVGAAQADDGRWYAAQVFGTPA